MDNVFIIVYRAFHVSSLIHWIFYSQLSVLWRCYMVFEFSIWLQLGEAAKKITSAIIPLLTNGSSIWVSGLSFHTSRIWSLIQLSDMREILLSQDEGEADWRVTVPYLSLRFC